MRVLITGAGGQLGRELMQRAPAGMTVNGLGANALDITDAAQVTRTLEQWQPELIINTAAYTHVDQAERETTRAHAVNCDGLAHLAGTAQAQGCAVLHVSTDYVFDGKTRSPLREDDFAAPATCYGASKLAGEQALARECSRHVVLRTSWLFGAHGHNFVKTILRLADERDVLEVVNDQLGGPTSTASAAQVLWRLAEHYQAAGTLEWGTYHFSGAPACTWYDFALEILRQSHDLGRLKHVPRVLPVSTINTGPAARRPSYSVLDCTKLRDTYGITQPDWRSELQAVLRALSPTR